MELIDRLNDEELYVDAVDDAIAVIEKAAPILRVVANMAGGDQCPFCSQRWGHSHLPTCIVIRARSLLRELEGG